MENNKVEIFKNEQFGEVRTVLVNGEPWFVAADVCKALEISDPTKAMSRLDNDEGTRIQIAHPQNPKKTLEVNAVNEPGLYSLVLGSRKQEAKEFKRWITHDVIPIIRKTGGYVANDDLFINTYLPTADEATKLMFRTTLATVRQLNEEKHKLQHIVGVQNEQIEEMKPKVTYYDIILNCKDAVPITNISKDYGMSARAMNAKLHELGVQYKQSGLWMLYQKYADKGYTQSKTFAIDDDMSSMHTYWTQKGRVFLYEFLKEHGVVPTMERNEVN